MQIRLPSEHQLLGRTSEADLILEERIYTQEHLDALMDSHGPIKCIGLARYQECKTCFDKLGSWSWGKKTRQRLDAQAIIDGQIEVDVKGFDPEQYGTEKCDSCHHEARYHGDAATSVVHPRCIYRTDQDARCNCPISKEAVMLKVERAT